MQMMATIILVMVVVVVVVVVVEEFQMARLKMIGDDISSRRQPDRPVLISW